LKEWIIYQDNCPMCKSQINTIVSWILKLLS
jgi:hypothetical protein